MVELDARGVARRRMRVATALATTAVLASAPATAQSSLYDWCTGVDHPPFEQDYGGDGASWFLIGASSAESGPHTLLAFLDGDSMELVYDGPGRDAVAFPIYSYGDYPWSIQASDGTVLQEGTATVGPTEDACDENTLSAPPEPSPTPTPTETSAPPTAGEATEAPTTETTPTAVTSEPATDTSGGGIPPWVWLGGLVLVGGGIFLGTRPRTPAVVPCKCSVSVAIEGPQDLAMCCMDVDWKLGNVRRTYAEDEIDLDNPPDPSSDPSKRHLDGDIKDKGWAYADHLLSATITPSCSEGATAKVKEATWDWALNATDAGLEVTVKVSVPVSCPGSAEAPPATAETTLRIPFRKAPCVITVLLEQNDWSDKLYNHCDVMITCGEYTEIFGYFPEEAGAGVLVGTPGDVNRWPEKEVSTDEHGLRGFGNKVGKDLKSYRGSMKTKAWVITPSDCSVCSKLREYWENLDDTAASTSYSLLGNNCVANVWKSLRAAGAVDAKPGGFGSEITPRVGNVLEEALDAQAKAGGAGGSIMEGTILD